MDFEFFSKKRKINEVARDNLIVNPFRNLKVKIKTNTNELPEDCWNRNKAIKFIFSGTDINYWDLPYSRRVVNEAWDDKRYPGTHAKSMYSSYRRNPWNPHGVGAWCTLRGSSWDYGAFRADSGIHVVANGSFPGGPREKTSKGELPWIQFDLGWDTWI